MTDPWSFILIPDTQYLSDNETGIKYEQYWPILSNWIINNVGKYNVKMIAHLGDIVDQGGTMLNAWDVAKTNLLPLLDLGIPTLLAAGNHDGDNVPSWLSSPFTNYNTHFGPHIYEGKPWFGGIKAGGDARNAFTLFTAGGYSYIHFQVEQYAGGSVMRWLRDTALSFPHRRVIVTTHAYLRRTGLRETWLPHYGVRNPVDRWLAGEEQWQQYFRTIPNMWAHFNGHFSGNIGYRVDPNDFGRPVMQGFYNFQWLAEGGKGRVVLMTVHEDLGIVHQRVVRTDLDEFEQATDTDGVTVFNYDQIHTVWNGTNEMRVPLEPADYAVLEDGVTKLITVGGVPHILRIT